MAQPTDTPAVVVVLGRGVSGLTCALELLREGQHVEVWGPRIGAVPTNALWTLPVNVEDAQGAIEERALATLPVLKHLRDTEPEAALATVRMYILGRSLRPSSKLGDRLTAEDRHRHSPAILHDEAFLADNIASGVYKDAEACDAVVMDSLKYLMWLEGQIKEHGGMVHRRKAASFGEVQAAYPGKRVVVVNCTGLGAHTLAGDDGVYPCRGQIVLVNAPHITCSVVDDESLAYVIPLPGSGGVLECGGTAIDGDWSTAPDAATTVDIMAKVGHMVPSLKGVPVEDVKVCLRPKRRGGMRLELEWVPAGASLLPVVHNYGHGGSGYLAAWGCAADVRVLVAEALSRRGPKSAL